MRLAMRRPLILSEPNTLAIFVSGGEVVLVVGVLQFVIPDVGPEELHDLGAGSFRLADDVSELGAELLLGWGAP